MTSTVADSSLARLRLLEKNGRDLVLGVPGRQYRLHLRASVEIDESAGAWITGRIFARPVRIDIVPAGGILIEPLDGRPRRVQGRVCALDEGRNSVVMKSAVPILLEMPATQDLSQFEAGQLVSCDVRPGAVFEPA